MIEQTPAKFYEFSDITFPYKFRHMLAINGEATKDLVNETPRKYEYAFGISGSNGGNASDIDSSASANADASPSRNSIVNMSGYQSAQALASQAQGMLTETKALLQSNMTSTTAPTITIIDSDLAQLRQHRYENSIWQHRKFSPEDYVSGLQCSISFEIAMDYYWFVKSKLF